MSLWHDRRGVPARGISNPGALIARHLKWSPSLADPDITNSQGPCADEINVALASLRPLEFANDLHTIWMYSTTGSWYKDPDVKIWISCQSVPDIAAWARETDDLPWIARWMNPRARQTREYVPAGLSQLDTIYANSLTERWRGVEV